MLGIAAIVLPIAKMAKCALIPQTYGGIQPPMRQWSNLFSLLGGLLLGMMATYKGANAMRSHAKIGLTVLAAALALGGGGLALLYHLGERARQEEWAAARAAGRVGAAQLRRCLEERGHPLGDTLTSTPNTIAGTVPGIPSGWIVEGDRRYRVTAAKVLIARNAVAEGHLQALHSLYVAMGECLSPEPVPLDRVLEIGSVRGGLATYRKEFVDTSLLLVVEMNSQ